MLGSGPQAFVYQPATVAAAPGQQAQDAVTMATAMWQVITSMVQQQQRMAFHGMGPGMPRTGFQQATGTPVGNSRLPQVAGTPRFPSPRQVHNTPIGTPTVATATSMPVQSGQQETGSSDLPQLTGQGVQSSQHTQSSGTPASDHQPTAFTLDASSMVPPTYY